MGKVYTAPPDSGTLELGRTLPSLLDEACERNPNAKAFNQRTADGWEPLSTKAFRAQAEELGAGLIELGLRPGDRVAFYTHSDLSFCLPDMACLTVGLVSVPIYLTHGEKAIRHIFKESEAKALVVSDEALLDEIAPLLEACDALEAVVVYAGSEREAVGDVPLYSADALRERGRAQRESAAFEALKASVKPSDLATIIYTSGTTGLPKGVMLSHENISSNAIAAFGGMQALGRGESETALSFLPLTHIFARTLQYGFMHYGISVYYSDPERIREDFRQVRPTLFAAVPRVLEKALERILQTGRSLSGVKRRLFDWSLALAERYDVTRPPTGLEHTKLRLADRLVLSKWREALGGRVKYVIVGGAALRPELVNLFGAAGVQVLQGYGLTETSPVVSYNRPERNRPGTVGEPLPGVEVTIADDGEILTRGPHVMQGYYRNEEATKAAFTEDGWFKTGDLGQMTDDGFLVITGRKKNLFKLSTGKFVMPQPLEQALEGETLVEHALVVGEGEKFCAALLFANPEALAARTGKAGKAALEEPDIQQDLKETLANANRDLPAWSRVKRAAVIVGDLTVTNEALTPTLKLRREAVQARYQPYIDALYGREGGTLEGEVILDIEPHPEVKHA
jgi:long-chain acyl-CoA synthetase